MNYLQARSANLSVKIGPAVRAAKEPFPMSKDGTVSVVVLVAVILCCCCDVV